MNKLEDIDFYLVTDSSLSKNGIFSDVENAIRAGCRIIQYREKKKDTKTMIKEARQIKKICNNKAMFLIDDRADVVLAVNADGIHIGQGDQSYHDVMKELPEEMIIGISVDNEQEAKKAEHIGATYVGAGAVFPTKTKKDASVLGIDGLQRIVQSINIPVVAIGGISLDNIKEVMQTGVNYYAIISDINNSTNISARLKEFHNLVNRG